MALLNPTVFPTHITKGVESAFEDGFGKYKEETEWRKITTMLNSKASAETQAFVGGTNGIQEWTDELSELDFKEYSYTLTNKKYGNLMVITKDLVEDDQTGKIFMMAKSLGQEVERFLNKTCFTTLAANGNGYDSTALIATTHSESGSNQSNKGTSALSASTFEVGRLAMRKFTDDKGEFLGVNPTTLLVPADLEKTGYELLNSMLVPGADFDTAGGGAQTMNFIHSKKYKLISTPELTDADAWYLIDDKRLIKPMVWQERVQPTLEGPIRDINRDAWVFLLRFRGVFGVGKWTSIYGGIPA